VTTDIDTRMAKAISHPVRARALQILNERVASPSDIARQIELPVANVSYHVNTLLRLGCIEEVETRHVRGAIEHLYRAVRRPLADMYDTASMPANVRHSFAGEIFAAAFADCREALEAGTVEERPDLVFTFTKMKLDPEGWANVHEILKAAYEAVDREQEAAHVRLEQGAELIPSRLTMLHYKAPQLG
jgi:DNA-binding transcriptional ArsR family regulator